MTKKRGDSTEGWRTLSKKFHHSLPGRTGIERIRQWKETTGARKSQPENFTAVLKRMTDSISRSGSRISWSKRSLTSWGAASTNAGCPAASKPGTAVGHGKPRRFTFSVGTVEVRQPQVRNLEDRFVSQVLPFFQRQNREVCQLLPDLYLHGLASGNFELALRGLLGKGVPLSVSSLHRPKKKWAVEYTQWRDTNIEEAQIAFLWGLYVKASLDKEKAALVVVIGAMRDGSKHVLALEVCYRESQESWAAVLRQLKRRRLQTARLFVEDCHLGLWAAVKDGFPKAGEQLCWNHKILNVLDALLKREHATAKPHLTAMMYAKSRAQAVQARKQFEKAFCHQPKAIKTVVEHWERLTCYYDFPHAHWKHFRTSNMVESPFARVRLRTGAARRFSPSTMRRG